MQKGQGVQGCRGRGSESRGPRIDRGEVWVGLGLSFQAKPLGQQA